jgi:hypothetical protein
LSRAGAIGVTTTGDKRNIFDRQKEVEAGRFDVGLDFAGDFSDDPTIQLTKYVSRDLSPVNSGATDRFLDALFAGQALTVDPRDQVLIKRECVFFVSIHKRSDLGATTSESPNADAVNRRNAAHEGRTR